MCFLCEKPAFMGAYTFWSSAIFSNKCCCYLLVAIKAYIAAMYNMNDKPFMLFMQCAWFHCRSIAFEGRSSLGL